MTPVHYTTTDLYLATYLMMTGCELVGITKISPFVSSITFTNPRILQMVNGYNAGETILFSVKAFGEKRADLKRIIKMQPAP